MKQQINWNFWIPAIMFFLFLIIEDKAFGTYYSSWLYGLVLILVGILYSVRYKLFQPALVICLIGLTVWHYFLATHFEANIYMLQLLGIDISINPEDNPFSMLTWVINAVVLLILMAVTSPVLNKAFKLEKSARRIFKTAASTVFSATNGFTSRPYSAGYAEYTKDQIIGFTHYLSGKIIVFPVYRENGIYLTFSMRRSPLSINEPSEISYVYFNYEGKITVHISSEDYKRYKEALSFDQLCESMSDVFKRFLNYYINNQESRIIPELNN
ncbi:MAG: hypothetical protein KAV70_07670 [Bacteroidales bacterium]|jgi:hypothetical protein|nr:hypothetical protein [Bacteroidales bacterium]